MHRKIKTLLFSTLYPSSARSAHGTFVETRLRELLKSGEVETKVVAPVPWFPLTGECFGTYGKFASTPKFENRNGIDIFHPRYFLPPKVGMNLAPYTLARAALPSIKKLIREGFDFDLIDAHYYYPDGVAAGLIAKQLGKPFVVTARGSDINLIPNYAHPRRLILNTANAASASVGVSKALIDKLAELGADKSKLKVFRNGVDLSRFYPEDRSLAREKLGLPNATILLSVGNLVELKGHHIAIEALPKLTDDVMLVIAGSGPERESLEVLTQRLGVKERVRFAGQLENTQLKWWYSAANALLLCSSREGWANVLLEAMACGTPVVATSTGGTPELVSISTAGQLMRNRTADALVEAFSRLTTDYPERSAVREYAEKFSWDETSRAQIELFSEIKNA